MLCYKDVDNVWYVFDANYTDTRDLINELLEKLGGDVLGNFYWCREEMPGIFFTYNLFNLIFPDSLPTHSRNL